MARVLTGGRCKCGSELERCTVWGDHDALPDLMRQFGSQHVGSVG